MSGIGEADLPRESIPTHQQLEALPASECLTVLPMQIDDRAHMNIRHYFDAAARVILDTCESLGLDGHYRDDHGADVFTAEHHIRYFSELRLDDSYSTRVRIDAASDKALCMTAYLVDETRFRLACTLESTLVNVDLATRRAKPFAAEITQQIDTTLRTHDQLPWKLQGYGRLTRAS